MRVLITGASGYLGARLCTYYNEKHDVVGLTHKQLDVTNRLAVEEAVQHIKPDLVIHCAAQSDVGACDQNPAQTRIINVDSAEYISSASRKSHAKLVFCSSDQLYFKSKIMTPHLEEEKVRPPHEYGKQKLKAEELVMENNPDAVCLRLSMMYALDYEGKQEHSNFIRNIIISMREKKPMSFSVNDFRSITDVWDVVSAMENAAELPGGVYNFGSENRLSTYEVVKEIVDSCGVSGLLSKNEALFADEPRNLMMNTDKIKDLGIMLPNTLDKLHDNLDIIKRNIKK